MARKILIINICKEKLHYYEFVKPICDIFDDNKIVYFIKGYKEVITKDLDNVDKVIICGTSLFDNEFMKNIRYFKWILDFDKPILGICGGMQIIGIVFGAKLKKKTEIGFYKESFNEDFLGLLGEQEVYHLHNYFADFNKLNNFKTFSGKKVNQAVKHKEKDIYGVLFHPEVRQKKLILNFIK